MSRKPNSGSDFQIGFWHPFGDHASEPARTIIERKRKEIRENGWTLWSFNRRTTETMEKWIREIEYSGAERVFVLCSDPKHSEDTRKSPRNCDYYLALGESEPRKLPDGVKVPHPMGKNKLASAFVVKKIIYPVESKRRSVDWFHVKDASWHGFRMKMRGGEHLIRTGRGSLPKEVYAILELKKPYLAEVGVD